MEGILTGILQWNEEKKIYKLIAVIKCTFLDPIVKVPVTHGLTTSWHLSTEDVNTFSNNFEPFLVQHGELYLLAVFLKSWTLYLLFFIYVQGIEAFVVWSPFEKIDFRYFLQLSFWYYLLTDLYEGLSKHYTEPIKVEVFWKRGIDSFHRGKNNWYSRSQPWFLKEKFESFRNG